MGGNPVRLVPEQILTVFKANPSGIAVRIPKVCRKS